MKSSPENNLPVFNVLRLLGRPVTYYPKIAHALDDVNAALFLSNFMYWEGKQDDKLEGWIYKNRDEITAETGLKRVAQESARRKLIALGVMEEERRGAPARLYYRFDWDQLNEIVSAFLGQEQQDRREQEAERLRQQQEQEQHDQHPPILETMATIFDEVYERQTSLPFEWGSKTLRGKYFGNLRRLHDCLITRIVARKTKDVAKQNGGLAPPEFQPSATYEEIVGVWRNFLDYLPEFHRTRNLTPEKLFSNFNNIILDAQNEARKTSSPTAAPAGSRMRSTAI